MLHVRVLQLQFVVVSNDMMSVWHLYSTNNLCGSKKVAQSTNDTVKERTGIEDRRSDGCTIRERECHMPKNKEPSFFSFFFFVTKRHGYHNRAFNVFLWDAGRWTARTPGIIQIPSLIWHSNQIPPFSLPLLKSKLIILKLVSTAWNAVHLISNCLLVLIKSSSLRLSSYSAAILYI